MQIKIIFETEIETSECNMKTLKRKHGLTKANHTENVKYFFFPEN